MGVRQITQWHGLLDPLGPVEQFEMKSKTVAGHDHVSVEPGKANRPYGLVLTRTAKAVGETQDLLLMETPIRLARIPAQAASDQQQVSPPVSREIAGVDRPVQGGIVAAMGIGGNPGLRYAVEVTGVLVPARIFDPVRRARHQLGMTVPKQVCGLDRLVHAGVIAARGVREQPGSLRDVRERGRGRMPPIHVYPVRRPRQQLVLTVAIEVGGLNGGVLARSVPSLARRHRQRDPAVGAAEQMPLASRRVKPLHPQADRVTTDQILPRFPAKPRQLDRLVIRRRAPAALIGPLRGGEERPARAVI